MAASPGRDGLFAMRVRLVAIAVIVAMAMQFFRNAHVVVAPDIVRELGASAASLAALTSAMFIASALCQIPAGILLDRYGPRRTVPVMLLLAAVGAGLFGYAESVTGLVLARACMGVGGAVLVMAGIIYCARWFDTKHFSTVAGGIMSTSHLGNLGSTVPMALLASWFGWRGAYYSFMVATALLAVVAWLGIRDAPPGHEFHERPQETWRETARGVVEVLGIPGLWRLMVMAFWSYATVACVAGLWAGPYLSDVHRLDTLGRGKVLFGMAFGLMAGSYAFTLIDRWLGATKRIIATGAAAMIAVFALLAAFPDPGTAVASGLLALFGLLGGFTVLIASHGRKFYPDRLIGRGITVVNCAVLFGAATLQVASGLIVSGLSVPGQAIEPWVYRLIFGLLGCVLAGSLAVYWRCPERGAVLAPPDGRAETQGGSA